MKDIKIVNGKAVFPEGIKRLSYKPFDKPEELVEALIPPTVEAIEFHAFLGCTSLRSVVIPASVNRLECEFSTCVSLVSITVDKDNEVYDSREDCNAIIDTVKNELIRGCQTTVIPSSVTSIGLSAFRGICGLEHIELPAGLKQISAGAFEGCSNLQSIVIPDRVEWIGGDAFKDCVSIKSITIPASVQCLGRICSNNPFTGCTSLVSVVVEEGNKIYDSRDNCNAIIETATNKLHAGCCKTTIPESVVEIGAHAFSHLTSLESISIPTSVTKISWGAFADCTSLVNFCIPGSVKELEPYVFSGCTKLESVTISEGVETLGYYLFQDCENLKELFIPASVRWIRFPIVYRCSKLTSIKVDKDNHKFDSREDCNAIIDKFYGRNKLFAGCSTTVIPPSVRTIGNFAFAGCGITDLVLPPTVTRIESSAFWNCKNLKSVTIPSSVTMIERNPFADCENLSSIKVSEENTVYDSREDCNAIIETNTHKLISCSLGTSIPPTVKTIGERAFCGGETDIVIPKGIKRLKEGVFSDCYRLKSVTLPAGVSKIDECVFSDDLTIYVPYGKVDYYRQRIEQSCWGCIVELPKENATKIK